MGWVYQVHSKVPSGHFVCLAPLSEALMKKLHNQSAWLVRQCSALILIKVNSQALVPALSQQGLSRLGVNNTYSVVADTFTSSGGGAWIPVKPRWQEEPPVRILLPPPLPLPLLQCQLHPLTVAAHLA